MHSTEQQSPKCFTTHALRRIVVSFYKIQCMQPPTPTPSPCFSRSTPSSSKMWGGAGFPHYLSFRPSEAGPPSPGSLRKATQQPPTCEPEAPWTFGPTRMRRHIFAPAFPSPTGWMQYHHRVRGRVDGKSVPIPVNIETVNTLLGPGPLLPRPPPPRFGFFCHMFNEASTTISQPPSSVPGGCPSANSPPSFHYQANCHVRGYARQSSPLFRSFDHSVESPDSYALLIPP